MLKKSGIIKKLKLKNEFIENDKYSKKFNFLHHIMTKQKKKKFTIMLQALIKAQWLC